MLRAVAECVWLEVLKAGGVVDRSHYLWCVA